MNEQHDSDDPNTHASTTCHGAVPLFYIGSFIPYTQEQKSIAHNGHVWVFGHICQACQRVCEVKYEQCT